jgi:hypothetical protein
VNLHTDIPTRRQIDELMSRRGMPSVSIYLPTDPLSTGEAARIELKNHMADVVARLEAAGCPKADIAAIDEELVDLHDDETFWRHQARSLAIFATPTTVVEFRLPNTLTSMVAVSDRFHLKPLLRSVTFPQVAFVLVLALGSVRLLEFGPEIGLDEVAVPDLPADVASAAGKSSIADRAPTGRLQGSEGQKVRMRQYARQIDQALRPLLAGLDVPLVLAATQPLDSIYRSVNTYPRLATESVAGTPENTSDAELVSDAREVLDRVYEQELADVRRTFEARAATGRTALDLGDVARAATFGAVDTLLVDIDDVVPGSVDEETGAVTLGADTDDSVAYGVVDEVARRVWMTGGRVLAVRRQDVPYHGTAAAILRYPV